MGIPLEDKPVYCLCEWEEVTTLEDLVPMIERTMGNPECIVHVSKTWEVDCGDTPG